MKSPLQESNISSENKQKFEKFLEKKEQETSAKLKIPTIPLKLLSPKLKSPSLKLLDEVKFEKNSNLGDRTLFFEELKTAETEFDEKENRIIQFLENSGIEMCVPEEKKENFFEKARENIVFSRRNSQIGDSKPIRLPSEQRLILDNSNLLTRRKSLSKLREDDKTNLILLDKNNEYNSKSPINKLKKIFKEVQYFTPKSKFSKEIDCFADHTDYEEFN